MSCKPSILNRYIATKFFSLALFIYLLLSSWCSFAAGSTIELELARVFKDQNVQDFLISEKYDGVRAIWKNGTLTTKNGNKISAPEWFLNNLPNTWLDGELWIKRNSFEQVCSVVLKEIPNDNEWRHVNYMIFDMPGIYGPFQSRYKYYKDFISKLGLSYLKPIIQHNVPSKKELYNLLEKYVETGAEGLMLHNKKALFTSGRSDNVLKLKLYMDDEATVIGYVQGKGRLSGKMGSLIVEYSPLQSKKIQFNIGTGFTDKERLKPPEVGSIITFKYFGYTKNGIPKFASFLRIRQSE